jgi:hypothetical protein
MWTADPEMTDGRSMTQIILKTTVRKEDTEGIADRRTNGEITVSGLANGPAYARMICRTDLKNVFWPNIFVGASLQIFDIQQYASGFKLGPAAILNQNPIFEMGSN